MRRLKCPRCKNQSAWLYWGFNPQIGRRYKQKLCSCGYEGAKRYRGQVITPEEYRQQQERMHQEITERLKAKGLA